MFKKIVSLVLAVSITSALGVTAFAGRSSTKIVPYGHDEEDVYNPGTETFTLEDGSEDTLTDGVDGITYGNFSITNISLSSSMSGRDEDDYDIDVVRNGKSYDLVVETNNFPTEEDLIDYVKDNPKSNIDPENYVEEITFRIEGTKILDNNETINMSSRTIKMNFGYGNVTKDDLKYKLLLDETDIEQTTDDKDTKGIDVKEARYIPGQIYYFDILRGDNGAVLDDTDLKDYTFKASAYYNSSMFKKCEIVQKSNGDCQLMIQADPAYDFTDPHFAKIRLSIYPKGNTRKRMDTYWAMGFQYAEDDVKSDKFSVDQDKPVVCLPDWVQKATARIENNANIEFYAIDTRKFNLSYDRDAIKAVNDNNKGAKTEFLTFHASPKFEGTAKISYNVNKESYVYQIGSNNELTQIDAKYSGGYMVWNQKVLGSYVVSDTKLKSTGAVIAEPEQQAPTTEQKPVQNQPSQNTNGGKLVPTGAIN